MSAYAKKLNKMINFESKKENNVKAVGLISGGLDSSLAAKLIKDMGFDVHGVYFAMPWGCCDKGKAQEVAHSLGIKFVILQLDERYLEIVRKPKHGYGSVMNPCRDCRIHMFSRAAQYMRHIGAEFVFTGEVLGQRPMSQMKNSMRIIEEETGLTGRLLRPLSAQLLEPTEMENSGLIDREKLLSINGRSRRDQITMADNQNIPYNAPAGGCLLTDKNFARRMEDTLIHGYRNFRETVALKWGRHYRFNKDFKIIIGRDKNENESLLHYAHPDDTIMQLEDNLGPTAIIKGAHPPEEVLNITSGLIQFYSKYKDMLSVKTKYWPKSNKNDYNQMVSKKIDAALLEKMAI